MQFPRWKREAEAHLMTNHKINPNRIRPRVWNTFFIQNIPPDRAAAKAATAYLNSLPLSERVRYLRGDD